MLPFLRGEGEEGDDRAKAGMREAAARSFSLPEEKALHRDDWEPSPPLAGGSWKCRGRQVPAGRPAENNAVCSQDNQGDQYTR